MGYNSFRSSSPSSKGNAGRHRLKFLVIVCMTMVFVLSSSTFLAPFSNLMRISACNIGPDGGVLARESDQFSAYTLQHQETLHVQDGRMEDGNSQESNQISDVVKVTEWFGESQSTIPVQREVRGEEPVSTTLEQEEIDESETKENDIIAKEDSTPSHGGDNVGTGTSEELVTSTLRETVDVASNASDGKNVVEQVPTESIDNGEVSNQKPVSSSAEEETPAITETKKEEVQNVSDTSGELVSSTLEEKLDVSPNTNDDKTVGEHVPTESTYNVEVTNQEPAFASAEEETPAVTEARNEEVRNVSETSEELMSSTLEEKVDVAPNANDDKNVEEQAPTEPTDNGEVTNQEPVSTSSEGETPATTESKNEEVQKDSDTPLQSSDSLQERSEELVLAAPKVENPSVSEQKNEGSLVAVESAQSDDNDQEWKEHKTTKQEPIFTTPGLETPAVIEAKNEENSEGVNSTQSPDNGAVLEEKNEWNQNQNPVPGSQGEQIHAATEPKNDASLTEQVSTPSAESTEAWFKEADIRPFRNEGDKPGNRSSPPNIALRRIADNIRSHSLAYSTRKDENQADSSCEGKYVYVYDLPPEFNTDIAARCDSLFPWFNLCDYFVDSGIGKPVNTASDGKQIMVPADRWFNTHQYALELVSHARIKKYKCLTEDPDQASLFYIPFYAGLDVIRWHFAKNTTNEKRDELTWKLLSWLEQKPSWSRRGGFDHVMVLGKISWDFHRNLKYGSWGSSMLELPQTQNVTKVLIERNPWVKKEIAAPHPTFFHPKSAADIDTWLNHIRSQERFSLVTFVGKGRPGTTNVRQQLIEQCRNASSEADCRIVECDNNLCQNPAYVNGAFLSTHFCMQPVGDSPTRRSVFDSLITGCIPVLFHPCTAHVQYLWHLPANETSWSVYISEDDVKEGTANVVEILKKIPNHERDAMRETIIKTIVPGLLYGAPGSDVSPYRDAFDITIENLLHRVSQLSDGNAPS
ncbi:uncharacterized protein [Physcomitrium patens]|uniref:Exostosin GT47 domain-containing protein n=1 Tax=Physcomitrium patens TaxID=3218 RepID=A0A2K1L9P9_PHYPA|nr:xyloglucan-specific galacturonosyltransferase 1-like isoform X1 [Physcomitrium patens]XP_024395510.1 xyloglucan-specific galacturonosyltransferase 1-like isoform X1 [Physcomitrium patens]XP_024395516.1 xyloglucan-specific galacturonosyltransferase 1-like isoform X1 [Physcomitrium patens]XP_024395522.1 xyloglucan-specific galacturonosyltransferase 1-like isoform X1 [Physcomitrium patens]XP_024395530.1 xyloglucan-specific galacturonosyltransferase 1-like isoform X1 [Physcomitrium patens]PNR62|eukprot:XP_024395502.1 xyloglucan-specific galacturonosyltransferase 1-like isoform X1 [Physcomitrella patens]